MRTTDEAIISKVLTISIAQLMIRGDKYPTVGTIIKKIIPTINEANAEAYRQGITDCKKAIADFNDKDPIARQCWYAVDKLEPKEYGIAELNKGEE